MICIELQYNLLIIFFQYFSKYLEFLFSFNEALEMLQRIIKFYFSPLNNDVFVSNPRKFYDAPLLLSAQECVFYQRFPGRWSTSERLSGVLKKYDDIIAMHNHNFNLYIVRKPLDEDDYILIESCDMRNSSPESSIFNTTYTEAVVTVSHPFLYFFGPNGTIRG